MNPRPTAGGTPSQPGQPIPHADTVTGPVTPTAEALVGVAPDRQGTSAADRASIAAQYVRLAINNLSAAYGLGAGHVVAVLADAAAHLDAANLLLDDRHDSHERQAASPPGHEGDLVAAARRHIHTALLVTGHLATAGSTRETVTNPTRAATAHLLATFAAERLHHALTQLTRLNHHMNPPDHR